MSKNKSEINLKPENSKKISELKSKRKWKQIAKKLNQPELENEEEEEEKFISNIKEGTSSYNKRLRNRYDEFGNEFTPFNMNEEMEEGNIDESGYYVFKSNKDYDPWYDSVKEEIKKKEIEKIKNKKEDADKDNEIEVQAKNEEPEKDFQYYGEEDLYYKEEKITKEEIKEIQDEIKQNRIKLIDYLSDKDETVSQAIQRLRPKTKEIKPQRKKQKLEEDENKEMKDENKEKQFKELLDIVSKLTELSYFNVYSDTYEKIENSYGQKALLKWNYRTVSIDDTNDISVYGPFTTERIKFWINLKLLEDTDKLKIEFQVLNFDNNKSNDWYSRDSPLIEELLS